MTTTAYTLSLPQLLVAKVERTNAVGGLPDQLHACVQVVNGSHAELQLAQPPHVLPDLAIINP